MINYKVLPDDGVKFEQLMRELFIVEKFETFWTGVGPDGGRDLVLVEKTKGCFCEYENRWLVSCKHFANAGRSVGVDDVVNIIDAMHAVNASGFILACSTYPSAALIRRLDEIFVPRKEIYKILDGIAIEKMIMKPSSIFLLNSFFPDDERNSQWKVFSTSEQGVWSASYKDHFFFYSSRDRMVDPPLDSIELIIEKYSVLFDGIVQKVKEIVKNDEFEILFRFRGFWWDDKHCHYLIYIDCQLEKFDKICLNEFIKENITEEYSIFDEAGRYANITNIDLRFTNPNFQSDHYHEDHYEDYNPFYEDIRKGKRRSYDNLVW